MTIELEDSSYDVCRHLDWALNSGVWNGRQVSWEQAPALYDEVQTRIFQLLLENQDEGLASQFALLGSPDSSRSLLAREIQEFDFKNNLVLQAGLKKSFSKFWKKHRKEILIGAAVVALVTVVVVVAVSTAGTGAGPAAAAGAALGSALEKDKKQAPPPKQIDAPKEPPIPSLVGDKLVFGETGVLIDGCYSSYDNILWNQCEATPEFSPALFPKFSGEHPSWIPSFSERLGKDITDLNLLYSHREEALPNPNLYLERGAAYFGAGEYDLALEDYKQFTVQSPAPLSVTEFSLGFAKGLPKGIYESGEGLFLFMADFVQHPIQTSSQIVDSVKTLVDLVRKDDWGVVAEVLAPEVHQLVTQWDTLPSDQRGELAGYAIGKHGADILVPGALAKVASKSVKSAQELAAVCKNFHLAQETLVLETAAGIGSSAKIGEIVHTGQTITALGEDLGFTAREMGQLQQAGQLENAIKAGLEKVASQTDSEVLKVLKGDLKQLANAGKSLDREGYTKAGRALAKHGGRPNTAFPQPKGSPEQINAYGQIILEEILSDPQAATCPNRFGGCDVFSSSGRGARFDHQGGLMGFLQPRKL